MRNVNEKMKNDDGGSKFSTFHFSLFTFFATFAKNYGHIVYSTHARGQYGGYDIKGHPDTEGSRCRAGRRYPYLGHSAEAF